MSAGSSAPRGHVVVVGDALLDIDLDGRAARLAPDAPVPVLDELVEHPRPGGAALAAALAASDGRRVTLVTALAGDDDLDADRVRRLLHAAGVEVVALSFSGRTPVKKRVRCAGQPLLRLDTGRAGVVGPLPDEASSVLLDADAVLVSDYGRGLTAARDVRAALGVAARARPVVWDPHPQGGVPVAGARVVTPNLAEAAPADGSLAAVSARASRLVAEWSAHSVAVTLGPRGALLSHGESTPSVFPAPRVAANDTCGAGDRFASSVAGALADGAVTAEAVQAGVLRASAFVDAGGASAYPCRPVRETVGRAADPHDLVARVRADGGVVVATGGCFDLLHAGHVATLEAARALGDCLVVCLNSDASVRRLKGSSRPLVPATDRARVLAALAPVDAVVVFDEDTPEHVLARLQPDVWVKGGDYSGTDLPEAPMLRSWGGQSVVLPYLSGRSTTALVASAAARAR